ncbi:hypothetical protein F53441_8445 [Fusarium austroafricanum]|uniref:GDT1 family protein n=1 Tax=Fusarium austroafricanum TaxID=2364996 RepID=A0A8H4KE66_9HYPO|nr:hypothetical protein F53441_8445 [Fusarium austroafricanum]
MKIRTTHSPLILILLPALANALSSHDIADLPAPGAAITEQTETLPQAGVKRHDIPTKYAPIDGRDGKPHHGPFIEIDDHKKTTEKAPAAGSDPAAGSGPGKGAGAGTSPEAGAGAPPPKVDTKPDSLPGLKGRPDDPTVVDGEKIPKTNDGVMFDTNRVHAQEGTTGTEGGVTERYRARKLEEDAAGEETFRKPSSPKEAPPLPHSEEEKIRASGGDKAKELGDETGSGKKDEAAKPAKPVINKDETHDYTAGLEKPDNLPERPVGQNKPVQDSAKAEPIDLSRGKTHDGHHDDDSIIQPFHSFVLSFTMILVSEVGDKTFLVAALMAMKHDRMIVFTAAFGALLVMTVLSAVLGHTVPALIPKRVTSFLAAGLFFVFGAKLMREGMQMDPNEGVSAEMHEVEQELAEKEKEMGRKRGDSVSAYALEMGMGGNGNGRRSRPSNRLMSPPRSPSQSPVRESRSGSGVVSSVIQGTTNLCSLLLSPAWVQTFIMTFLGEWGDRSQIATIAMAAGQDYWWVTLGAMCGHAICTGVAVIGGRAIAGRVSMKVVTIGGATAFLIFGVIYLLESLYS